MITFNISNELFADDAIVTISCKHLPDMFKMPHRCNPNEVSVLKKKTITIALKELVRRMAVQRYESLRHSNFLKSEHLKSSFGYYSRFIVLSTRKFRRVGRRFQQQNYSMLGGFKAGKG